jgi:hypothetical protein
VTLPRPDDARIEMVYPALLEYSSVISPVSATLFYAHRLPELGYTQTITEVYNEKAQLGFSKNGQQLSIIIVPDDTATANKITLSLN